MRAQASAHNQVTMAEPWLISFEERASYLRRCIKDGCEIVLHLNEAPNTTTFRYRCYNVFRWLENSEKWRAVYFYLDEFSKIKHYIPHLSMAIVSRMRWSFELQRFLDVLKDAGTPLLYDTDDLVFDIELLPLLVSTISADIDYYFSYISRCGYAASLTEGFTTTNAFLGNRLEGKFNKPYAIVPNSLNSEQLRVSREILREKNARKTQKTSESPFTIGYFSGTNTHNNDFLEVFPELLSLLETYPNINLEIVGFLTLPKEALPFFKAKRIIQRGLVDMIELQHLISNVDVNIAPLTVNVFTQCKSELKYFESAVVETVTCATPTIAFKECITHGENGFLCKQGEWFNTIESLYRGEVDRNLIGKNAHDHAVARYSGEALTAQIEEAYDKIIKMLRK